MKRIWTLMSVLSLFIMGVAPANAGILFNNFGAQDSYDVGSGWIVSGPDSIFGQFASAQAFSPGITGTVTEVRFAAGLDASDGGLNRIVFNLTSDNSGTPGAVLESYTFVDQMGFFGEPNPTLVSTSLVHPLLSAGTRYWMVAVAGVDTFAAWNYNDQHVTGTVLFSDDNGANWHPDGGTTLAAFEVIGTPVPEPSSFAMLSTALLVGASAYRRHLAKGQRKSRESI